MNKTFLVAGLVTAGAWTCAAAAEPDEAGLARLSLAGSPGRRRRPQVSTRPRCQVRI